MNHRKKRKHRIFNRIKLAAVLIGALLAVLMLFVIFTHGHKAAMIECGDVDATAPKITADSGVLYSVDLDEVVYSKNADSRCEPYSVTKLVTAYIAAQELDLDQTVTISKAAADDDAEGSTMFLKEGEKVTVNELLYGALMLSGNDAAYALAEATCGDVDSFVELMNDTVAEWGCNDTHFANPTGWKAKDHYTTANDLLIIAQHTLADETVFSIACTKKYKMAATNLSDVRKMENHTTLIDKKNSGVLGGKTGYWSDEDCAVALEYSKKELTAILILLGDTEDGREKDVSKLLKFAHKVTPGYIVDEAGADTGKIWVKHGKTTHVETTLAKTVRAYPEKQKAGKVKVKIHYDKVEAPLSKGTKVGTYEVYVSGELTATRDILLAESVETGLPLSNIYISDRVGITIVLVILALALTIILLRIHNKRKRR